MKIFEYLRLKLDNFPEDVIKRYTLKENGVQYGYVYIRSRKGVYGLPYARVQAQQFLEKYWIRKDTRKSASHQDFGITSGDLFLSC